LCTATHLCIHQRLSHWPDKPPRNLHKIAHTLQDEKDAGKQANIFSAISFLFFKKTTKNNLIHLESRDFMPSLSLSLSLSHLFGKVGNRHSPLQKKKKIILLVALETI
jgi:hypothetical protein